MGLGLLRCLQVVMRGHVHCFHVLECYDRCLPRVHVNDCEFWSGDPDPEPRQVLFIPDLPGEARATGCSECRDPGFGIEMGWGEARATDCSYVLTRV